MASKTAATPTRVIVSVTPKDTDVCLPATSRTQSQTIVSGAQLAIVITAATPPFHPIRCS